ncbi:MAG TPA: PAS domain-containing protein [Aliidongia sp.]|nr:PAS domain-containing protein [Aliidongia sp.]
MIDGIEAALLAAGSEPKSKTFVRAWLGWRGERSLPLRSKLDLVDVKPLLRLVMLTEVRGPDEIMVRVCGTQLSEYLGFELTGRDLLALTPPADRPIRRYRFREMAGRPCGAVFQHHHVMPSGRLYPSEVIMLPIDPDDPAKPRLLMHNFAPLRGQFTSKAVPDGQAVPLSHDFRFLDIGFGIPDSTAP